MIEVNLDILQRIWEAQGLGTVQSVVTPKRGVINACRIVNDTHVIRFDRLDYEDVISRYKGEQIIYEQLRDTDVPVPEVIALDLSKTLAPYAYIILSKMGGTPLIDDWDSLSVEQRAQVGNSLGRYLTIIHEHKFDGFGSLCNLNLSSWGEFISNFVNDMGIDLAATGILSTPVVEKIKSIIEKHRPLYEIGMEGWLIHTDFQFSNVLQKDGVITAILDFEFALAGDPVWDFRLEDRWEDECIGCRDFIYAGYSGILNPDHNLRVRLYKLLQYMDELYFLRIDQPDLEQFERAYKRTLNILESFS